MTEQGARDSNERMFRRQVLEKMDRIFIELQESNNEVLTLAQAARILGIHENTMRKIAQTDPSLKCRKERGRWYFTRRALFDWIEVNQ